MKIDILNLILFFTFSNLVVCQGQENAVIHNEENGTRRRNGYIRGRRLKTCTYTMGPPCWGVQVCRRTSDGGYKTYCVTPMDVHSTDVCGPCDAGQSNPQGGSGTVFRLSNNNRDDGDGDNQATPQEVDTGTTNGTDADDGSQGSGTGTTGTTGTTVHASETGGSVSLPNAANCPSSGKSPCVGIPVCRTIGGKSESLCLLPDYVFASDECGYCEGQSDPQEDDGDDGDDGNGTDGGTDNGGGTGTVDLHHATATVYLPNAANCPLSEKSPCVGVRVCRTINGNSESLCLLPDYVFASDECGFCNEEI